MFKKLLTEDEEKGKKGPLLLVGRVKNVIFLKWAIPGLFPFNFGLCQTNINTILQQINVKNIHPVYDAGIRTHDLQNMSLSPSRAPAQC